MMEQAVVLYDFDGLTENNEISLQVGETVTILNKDIGDGWWEGQRLDGSTGLFPEAYVKITSHKIANSSLTPRYSNVPGESFQQHLNDVDRLSAQRHNSQNDEDDNDDTWSEDWDDNSSVLSATQNNMPKSATQYGNLAHDLISLNSVESRSSRAPGSVSKNLNRFSSFVKHGGEDYVLGKADARVRQIDQVQIISGVNGLCWKDTEHQFTCSIENPKQLSKMKGLKKFISYNLTPSDTAVTVQRRYKHFDWLYTRLLERFPIIPVPRLPEKQASGRFEEDFIEARMARLHLWVSYLCRHPLLSKCQLFRNFITLTEHKAWKMSKRQAEKDRLVAGNFFLTVSIDSDVYPSRSSDGSLDSFKKTARAMDEAISQYSSSTNYIANKYATLFKKEYQSFGRSMVNVACSFNSYQTDSNKSLTIALKQAGQAFLNVGDMFANQPKEDYHPLADHLWLYKGIFDAMPDVWHMQSGSTRKVKECRKLKEEGKMTEAEFKAITERADNIGYCMQAEITHFHKERIRSFTIAHREFIEKQAKFFEMLAAELRSSLTYFDEIQIEP